MPNYVYACKNKRHPRKEVTHAMNDNPLVKCGTCGKPMHRVPQAFRFYMSPIEILYDWCDENWRRYKARKRGKPNTPRFSPDKVNSPTPIGGKDFEHRRLSKRNDRNQGSGSAARGNG